VVIDDEYGDHTKRKTDFSGSCKLELKQSSASRELD
jgi:hypothetical protein